jgi:DNA polymerase I-like protein with 3'-5' exonuclease and polymerase domains
LKYCIKEGEWPIAQFHDEGVWVLQEGAEDRTRDKLRNAIDKTNEELQLNVTLDIDIQFGMYYSDIH